MSDDIVTRLLNSRGPATERAAKLAAADEIKRLTAELAAQADVHTQIQMQLSDERDALRAELESVRGTALEIRDEWKSKFEKYFYLAHEAQRRVERLEEALKPFSDALDGADDDEAQTRPVWETGAGMEITFGDLRRARAALNGDDRE